MEDSQTPQSKNHQLQKDFFEVAEMLNEFFSVTPILFGSLGLFRLIGDKRPANDVDILVPEFLLRLHWETLQSRMNVLHFRLVDEHEHEFIRTGRRVAFGRAEDLKDMLGVDVAVLPESETQGARYKYLNLDQFRRVYTLMARDSYRTKKLHKDDALKVQWIAEYQARQLS